jgi:hypothetical protein
MGCCIVPLSVIPLSHDGGAAGSDVCHTLWGGTIVSNTVIKLLWNGGFLEMHKDAPLSPNVMVEWLTLPLRIREVSGSDLCQETGYSD